jgi:lysophospholipase L1-like esterase
MISIGIGIPIYKNQGAGGTAPVNTIAPVLSGLNMVGETLTSTQGTWDGTPPISYSYTFLSTTDFINFTVIQSSASPNYVIQVADSGKSIRCNVLATNDFGTTLEVTNYVSAVTMDLINLQSYDAAKFTLSGSNITAWTEQDNVTQWTKGSAPYPTLSSGVPTFAGSGTSLERSADINLTTFCAYAVVRLSGETTSNQAIFASKTGTNWVALADSTYRSSLNVSGSPLFQIAGGYRGKRDVVFWIRRTGNTVTMGYNNSTCLQLSNTLAGQNTPFGRLMGISGFSSFSMIGTLKSFVVTSTALSDTQHADTVAQLYNKYNLGSNTAIDTVIGFGDSNTVGQGVTSYLVAVASNFGTAYKQLGIAGSLFTTLNSSSGFTRYPTQVYYNPYSDRLVIQYGTNDILSSVSSSTFSTEFNTMMTNLIAQGFNTNRICLCSVPYQRDNVNSSQLDAYRTVINTAATTYGTRYFDLLQAMRDGGGNSLLSDNVHLNASGMTIWSNGVIAALS